jgi:mRNA interferase RelE/StbE
MKAEFRKQFIANLKGIKNRELANEIEYLIDQIEVIGSVDQISGIKKLTGHHDYYRIRIEDYRIGIKLSGDTVIFVCMYHRSIIYKLFP